MAERHLWSRDSGLYVFGDNGMERCGVVANFNQNWEFPARATFSIRGREIFNDSVGFRIRGNCSRRNAMKSFGLYWRNEYGKNVLEHRLFPGTDTYQFKRLLFRNSGQDFPRTMMRDAALQRAARFHGDFEYQEYRPVVVYLNGNYWGIHNMREMINNRYFQYKFGVDHNLVDILTGADNAPVADEGSIDDFMRDVIGFVETHDLSLDEHLHTLSEHIDLSSYIDYFVVQTYIMNKDWPRINIRWWREKTSEKYKKWRWVLYDTDHGMLPGWDDKVWLGDWYGNYIDEGKADGFFIFNHLTKNESFKKRFLERYLYFIDVVFEPQRFESIVSAMREDIREEYPYHALKWNTLSPNAWEREVDRMIRFNNRRNPFMREIIIQLQDAVQ